MNKLINKATHAVKAVPLHALLSMLLVLVVGMLYAPVVNFEFLNYDDPLNVTDNPYVTQFTLGKLAQIWTRPIFGLYIPLTYTVWGVLGRLAAWLHPANNPTILDPAVFHVANVILHAGAVLVVFAILRLLLKGDWPAAAGAMLFALHPVQVSPVAWVSGMRDVLAGFLGLLAVWQYLSYTQIDQQAIRFRRRRYLSSLGFFIAALLAKPSVTSIPLMAAILAIVLLKREWRRVALELSPWLLLVLPLVIITKGVQPSEGLDFLPNLWQRFLVAGDAITFYHTKLLWPFELGPDYGRDPQEVLASGWGYVTGLLPFVIAAFLFWRLRRPWLVAGGLVFVAALLPVLGFIPFAFQDISTVANRYLYPAMLAPALLFGRLLQLYPGRRMAGAALLLLFFLGLRSADRLPYKHDSVSFNLRSVELNPKSSFSYNNLGVAYKEKGRISEAIAAFKQAIANDPEHQTAYVNLGSLYAKIGFLKEAKKCYLKAVELAPYSPNPYMMLGLLAKKHGEFAEALTYYNKALALAPGSSFIYANLAVLNTELKQFDEAIANYRKALAIDPYFAEVYNNLGKLYVLKDQKDAAEAAFRQTIWLKPNGPNAYNNLGKLLISEKRSAEAVPLLQKAVALAPGQPEPAYNLGLAYIDLGQAQEAAELFRLVLSIDPGFSQAQYNLAHAEDLEKNMPSEINGEKNAGPSSPARSPVAMGIGAGAN